MNIRLCIRNISVQFKAKVLSPDRHIATASLISSIKERYGMMTVVAIRVLRLSDGRPKHTLGIYFLLEYRVVAADVAEGRR